MSINYINMSVSLCVFVCVCLCLCACVNVYLNVCCMCVYAKIIVLKRFINVFALSRARLLSRC